MAEEPKEDKTPASPAPVKEPPTTDSETTFKRSVGPGDLKEVR
jgi:hypothetical protein